jgi:pyruvate kinase
VRSDVNSEAVMIKSRKIDKLIADTNDILTYIYNFEEQHKQLMANVHPKFKRSVRNLLHYKALRSRDIRDLQNKLEFIGLSRLARAEAHVLPSLINTQIILNRLLQKEFKKDFHPELTIKKVQKLQANHTKEVFGFRSKNRRVRIMVTMPTEAASNYKLVKQMVKNGMNCARINCAHDDPQVWEKIIYNIHRASNLCERRVKICMDIAGPKIRTGDIVSVSLDPNNSNGNSMVSSIKNKNSKGVKIEVAPPKKKSIVLKTGDVINIHKSKELGEPAVVNISGKLIKNSHVSCSNEKIFKSITLGEQVFFDDGKIKGVITNVVDDNFDVRITNAGKEGSKLKAHKGINLPNSNLKLSALTEKDKEDLKFIAKNADTVNCSFVNSGEDVEAIYRELETLGAINKLGVIFKIETMKAYNNLFEIIIAAMRSKKVGIMIARGDLAVETGWEYIGLVQKEIVSVCNAAHIPVVWATEVLASLAKNGAPSRSEITDAINSIKTDCVMLNKGPFIIETIQFLDRILNQMENHQFKNTPLLPKMKRLV